MITDKMTPPVTLHRQPHSWLRRIAIAFQPGPVNPLTQEVSRKLLSQFKADGHIVLDRPHGTVDVLLTTAQFNQPVEWRQALMFTARRRFSLEHNPTVFTLVAIPRPQFDSLLAHFQKALTRPEPDPADYDFPGLAPNAYLTLYEQGRRAGPILSLVRLVQSQTMCIRVILVIGEHHPEEAYTFDLVGAYPRTSAADHKAFYQDLVLRVVTAVSTHEVTQHEVAGETIPLERWRALETPSAMLRAGQELGRRQFFTRMVEIANLVNVPALNGAIASQYSEGCFATWDAELSAMVATITGSARPVDKGQLTEDELSVIQAMRPDGKGAVIRHVEGKRNDPPSTEAVEMVGMDRLLPTIWLGESWKYQKEVPVARSKLHGHRGVRAFDPALVEHVFLDPAYYHFPVSCSTEAQASAIISAFARSQALIHPDDPRKIIFTILPGHGAVIVEKWVAGKAPFQVIWEAMDDRALVIDSRVPQGPLSFIQGEGGRMVLKEQ
ncbi:MAG: hypothetical protein HPY59_04100 [Anaerolineae bacterium]|nr:hypothetical protein [Anaerolineae bacterium]